ALRHSDTKVARKGRIILFMANQRGEEGPFDTWNEVQDHRYDPGYWTGGRVHPIHRRRAGGNRYGWLLVLSGMVTIAFGASSLRSADWSLAPTILMLVVGLIMVVAGFRLVAPQKKE
ncbi:MAG TPA: hypothetical protein VHK90_14885, partial [Thermoanaerobaculia bacterium]|nr:hypothetical protein [Thermoanaerobaculia bacterium]